MSVLTRAVAALTKVPPARTRKVAVDRDLHAVMPDGAVLLADRWYPVDLPDAPVILMRSPYGRAGVIGAVLGGIFAERGYQAVIQSCRGKHGSTGEFVPFRNEAADGRATLDWLAAQPWFTGKAATWGASYLGLVQWSSAADYPDWVRAMATAVTSTHFESSVFYPGGIFALETALGWGAENVQTAAGLWEARRRRQELDAKLPGAFAHLPLGESDEVATGSTIGFYQDWLSHEAGDPWWHALDFTETPTALNIPVNLVGGWYDLFIADQVADYVRLRDAGVPARLTIGPWSHGSPGLFGAALREAFDCFDANLLGASSGSATGVRVFLLGSERWVDLPDWPPPAEASAWHLHAGGKLFKAAPEESEPDRYAFDPADPTPGLGGANLSMRNRGPKDQRSREERADVLTYTSEPLSDDLTVIGPVRAELHVGSSLRHTDFFVTLCDVEPGGKSINITTGGVRLRDVEVAPDAPVAVDLYPTGCVFRRGHRLRVQVASGEFPRFAPNTGSGEPQISAVRRVVAQQALYHDPAHPSRIILPLYAPANSPA